MSVESKKQITSDTDLRGWRHSTSLRYAVAAGAVALAIAVRLMMDTVLGNHFPFALPFFAVLISAWFGGFGPALFAVVLSGVCADFLLLEPRGSLVISSIADRVGLALYTGTGIGVSLLGGSMHRATAELKGRIQERTAAHARVKNAAEKASALLAAIVESSFDAIIGKDLNSVVTSWNIGAERMFGYTAAEMIGQSITKLIPSTLRDEEEQILAKIRKGDSVQHFDTIRVRKDGVLIDVSVTVSPIRDSSGTIVGASKVARDVTERKQSAAALRASDERMRLATETTGVGIWEWNILTNTVRWDAQMFRIYGVRPSPDGVVHYSEWRDRVVPEDLQRQEEILQDTIRRRGQSAREFRIRRAGDQEERFIQAVETIRSNAAGEAEWVVGTNLDITERKLAEEKVRLLNAELEQRVIERTAALEAANKELEAFSYSVSHDLRAPLRAVNGFAGLVLQKYGPQVPDEAQRYLERIRHGGQRMGELIDDLLAFSRLSRQALQRQTVDMGQVVRNVIEELTPQIEGRKVDLLIRDMPPCSGDPALLKQVWVNLISNAFKYSRGRQPAVVEIGFAGINGEGAYFVRDNGTGFDMRYAHKLFTVFQRLHLAEEFEGTGVGLAIVQRIVVRHSGKVWAEARPDLGATFRFTIGEDKQA